MTALAHHPTAKERERERERQNEAIYKKYKDGRGGRRPHPPERPRVLKLKASAPHRSEKEAGEAAAAAIHANCDFQRSLTYRPRFVKKYKNGRGVTAYWGKGVYS